MIHLIKESGYHSEINIQSSNSTGRNEQSISIINTINNN